MKYLAIVSYDGTNYVGWQIQPNGDSIEEEIEKVLSKILNTPTKIYGSGRTDAGVHALGQTFHFEAKEITDLGKFTYSINSLLPKDIFIKNIKEVDDSFHARYLVKRKEYKYLINAGEYNPFEKDHIYQLLRPLDISLMKEGLKLFIGEHNFQNFTSKEEDESNFVRTIYEASIKEENNIITIDFIGSGFMRYMVRNLVGSLIEVGLHRLSIEELKMMMDTKERKVCQYKAPSNGLYLVEVKY